MGKSERDRQVIEKSERQASDGEGRETDRQMTGKDESKAKDGGDLEIQENNGETNKTGEYCVVTTVTEI